MSSNILIKGIAVVFISLLVVVVLKIRQPTPIGSDNAVNSLEDSGLSTLENGPVLEDNGLSLDPLPAEFLEDEYGVDVDSPVETMRTLTHETRAVREDSEKLQQENKQLKQDIAKLLEMEASLNKRVNSRFSSAEKQAQQKQKELEHTQTLTRDLIAKLENRLEQLQGDHKKSGQPSAYGYDIGQADIPSGLGYDELNNSAGDEIIWTQPLDAQVDPRDPTKITLPDFDISAESDFLVPANSSSVSSEKNTQDISEAGKLTKVGKSKKAATLKAYTLPQNATLFGSVSMTAMLGRIPMNGQVVDPYPFKVIVGETNLSSNGVAIPGISGITLSGIAKGDWTLSCVSGEITSMTFTFQDGTLVTFPESSSPSTTPIAWFSDKNGIPCVSGQRLTNAASYLSSRIALTAAAAYADVEAKREYTTTANGNGGVTRSLTGEARTAAKNTAISGGLSEATDWIEARQQSSFDAVYVPPGTELAIHINQTLHIDYQPQGRKVNHHAILPRSLSHALD